MGRRLVVGFESALEFWRSARQGSLAAADDDFAGAVIGRRPETVGQTARRAAALCGLDTPIRVVVPSAAKRYHCGQVKSGVFGGPLGDKYLYGVDSDVFVCRMPAVLVQLATQLDEIELAQLACEMMGSYGFDPDPAEGFDKDVKPLVAYDEFASYIRAALATKTRGARRAMDALSLASSNSNSPRETDAAIFMKLTRARGGLSLSGFEMNATIELPEELQKIVGQGVLRPDFYWPGAKLIVEYESDEFHATPEAMKRDERRRRAFEAAGYMQRRLTNDILKSDEQFNIFMSELARRVDPHRTPATKIMLDKRRDLRERLFGPQDKEAALDALAHPYEGVIL
ncbi:hypothetical protein [Thermophilibacter provencensis]|uniref:DUF559 domain-containing protein n=1 Tax=Thermophilibacter provencensis TaxID=1852386 RepID=A0ABT7V4S2_9ACTN|nr:hypothetical protein [Thermophilibacter provencensis]MDM8271595.1 hypothetical protein [Thermophilibacter provencensis]